MSKETITKITSNLKVARLVKQAKLLKLANPLNPNDPDFDPRQARGTLTEESGANANQGGINGLLDTTPVATSLQDQKIKEEADKAKQNIKNDSPMFNTALGTVGGAGLGGSLAYMLSDPENATRNSVLGTVGGGLVGGLGTHLAQKYLNKASSVKQAGIQDLIGKLLSKTKGVASTAGTAIKEAPLSRKLMLGGAVTGIPAGAYATKKIIDNRNKADAEAVEQEAAKNQEIQALKDTVSAHRTAVGGGAALGGVLGGGAAYGLSDKNKVRNTLLGGTSGALAGGALAHYLENYLRNNNPDKMHGDVDLSTTIKGLPQDA